GDRMLAELEVAGKMAGLIRERKHVLQQCVRCAKMLAQWLLRLRILRLRELRGIALNWPIPYLRRSQAGVLRVVIHLAVVVDHHHIRRGMRLIPRELKCDCGRLRSVVALGPCSARDGERKYDKR